MTTIDELINKLQQAKDELGDGAYVETFSGEINIYDVNREWRGDIDIR